MSTKSSDEPNSSSEAKKNRFHRLADAIDSWHITRILAALSHFGILLAAIVFVFDFFYRSEDRARFQKEQQEWAFNRQVMAWDLLIAKDKGNTGKRLALDILVSNKEPLVGVDLSCKRFGGGWDSSTNDCSTLTNLDNAQLNGGVFERADLSGTSLREANMVDGKFQNATLAGAVLFGADLERGDFSSADFAGSDLRGANLRDADLSNAGFRSAEMKFANLDNANIAGADFTGAVGLTEEQLSKGCILPLSEPPIGLEFEMQFKKCLQLISFDDLLRDEETQLHSIVANREGDIEILFEHLRRRSDEQIESIPSLIEGLKEFSDSQPNRVSE